MLKKKQEETQKHIYAELQMEIALQSPIKTRKQSKDKNKAVVTDCRFVLKNKTMCWL